MEGINPMDASRATVVAATISAAAALTAAYFTYQVGQRQLELQRSVLLTEFIVKTVDFDSTKFRAALNRLCATSAPRDDVNAIYKVSFREETCPPTP
jgi:hypothetical protein